MPYALVSKVDDVTAATIRKMWETLAAPNEGGEIFSDDQIRFGYPAHVTWAVTEDDEMSPETFVATVKPVVASWKPIRASFEGIGTTPPRRELMPLLLWPTATDELVACNKAACDAFPSDKIKDYYRPGKWYWPGGYGRPDKWKAHDTTAGWVTLARDIRPEQFARALTAVLVAVQWDGGINPGILDRVAAIHFRQEGKTWHVRELWQAKL